MIDTHSHIYLEQFDSDRDEMISRAVNAGVKKIYLPNIDFTSIDRMIKVKDQYTELCSIMMGLHPTSVKDDYEEQLEKMYPRISKGEICAIGEIGIDLYWDKTYLPEQIKAFEIQINWAKEFDLPIVIHARDAFNDIFEVLDRVGTPDRGGIFHSFGGNGKQAEKALSYKNFLLGINGVVTFKNSSLAEVLKKVSLDKLVLETDAPFLTPTPYRGKRNEPSYLIYIVEKLAIIYNTSTQQIIDHTTKNASILNLK